MSKMIATKQEREKVLEEVDDIVANRQEDLISLWVLARFFKETGDINVLKKLDARFAALTRGILVAKSVQDVLYKYIYNNGKEKK